MEDTNKAILGSVAGGLTGIPGQLIANAANKKLAKYSYQKDLEQWHRTNLYNSPGQQMARLRSAGLNPNLVYGNGSVGNTSGPGPSYDTPEYKLDTAKIAPDPMQLLGQTQQIKNTEAATDNIKENQKNTAADTVNKQLQSAVIIAQAEKLGISIKEAMVRLGILSATAETEINQKKANLDLTGLNLESGKVDLEQKKKINPYQADIVKNQATKSRHEAQLAFKALKTADLSNLETEQRTKNLQTEQQVKEQEKVFKQFENQWRSKGVTSSDNYFVRVVSETLNKLGSNANDTATFIIDYINSITNTGNKHKSKTGAQTQF